MTTKALLVLGTTNRKKCEELAELLRPLCVELKTLADFPEPASVVEDGQTFAENAALKAIQQARQLGQWVLGEDSGLVVDALGGGPGVMSARFSGDGATDESNNRMLLEELGTTSIDRRTAHYVCSIAVADPEGEIRTASEARCNGRIRFERAGSAGFGYDPLFEIIEYHRTFGQLGLMVKSTISHRARAVALLIPPLRRVLSADSTR
jgi:XTP/dITP diphosphohydrolase